MRKQYIGITGFMQSGEALGILNTMALDSRRFGSNAVVMFGVLASLKTLRGLKNKWPNRYPLMSEIPQIFQKNPSVFNLIHYNTSEPETLHEQLRVLTGKSGGNLHGFQLNLAWPALYSVERYRKAYPAMQIVLQVGIHAFEKVGNSPEKLVRKVGEYWGLVDYVLLDSSGGHGKPFDPDQMKEYLSALTARPMNMGFGVAGGLGPDTLDLVRPLAMAFPNLSIDAEGLLRDPFDLLDITRAQKYLFKARQMFRR